MNQNLAEIEHFFSDLKRNERFRGDKGGEEGESKAQRAQTWIAPQFLHIDRCLAMAQGSGVFIGAQNCSDCTQGAYTGEVSSMHWPKWERHLL